MKTWVIFLLLSLVVLTAYSQHTLDSLEALLKTTDSDSGRISLYNRLISEYGLNNPGRAIELGKEVLPLLNINGNPEDWALYNKGIGIAYNMKGEYVRAIDYFLNSWELFESVGDTIQIPRVMNNIGIIYHEIRNLVKAREFYLRCLEIYNRRADSYAIAVITNNLGTVYEDMGDLDSAFYYHNQSLSIALEHHFKDRQADSYLNVGSIHVRKEEYDTALNYLYKAYQLDLENDNSSGIIETYALLAEANIGLGRLKEAYPYLKKGLELSLGKGTKKLTSRIYHDFGTYYYRMRDYKKAYEFNLLHTQLADSIVNSETKTQIAALQFQYENNRKEQAISHLTEINSHKDLQLRSQKERSGLLVIIVLFLVLISGLLWIYYKIYSRANNLLEIKNRKISEQNHELELQSRKLQELSNEKDNMIGFVAHDLKSPLSKIMGLSGLLRHTGNLNQEQSEYLNLMDKVVVDGNALISRILDLNRLETGEFMPKFSKVNLKKIVEDVSEAFKKASGDKNINICKTLEDNVECNTDPDMIYSILNNLVSNAIKFSDKNKTIFLSCRRNGTNVILSVRDEGPGIDQEDTPLLFHKYSRLSARPTGGESSSGLGLAIVKLTVEKLNGNIEVRSELKKGSEFIVRLPLNHE